jgi:hypothetical protein
MMEANQLFARANITDKDPKTLFKLLPEQRPYIEASAEMSHLVSLYILAIIEKKIIFEAVSSFIL